jgi:AcrR family transcriptional regulator
MTVYYQFGSKAGLLEALLDDLAARGEIGERLARAFQRPDARAVLAGFVAA